MSANPTPSGGAAPPTNQPHQTDTDPLVKYQTLLPILKESVTVSELRFFRRAHRCMKIMKKTDGKVIVSLIDLQIGNRVLIPWMF